MMSQRMEEEEHLASADAAIVIPTVELVSPPKGTKPDIPPPFTDITTTGVKITVRLQASISLPPEAEVEILLVMPTLPPSPLTSLSPPSAGERLASGNLYCQWELSPGSGNTLCILFPTGNLGLGTNGVMDFRDFKG
uniref:Uncharacterized protein n=1 Tax=Tanacetum cinerariifolium TaxID=118510 RepID=A0A6L2KXM6_TANCI|nr:hypothetical protein [Tanacetum cinerariifolium]